MSRRDLIDVAMGRTPADTLIEGGSLVNVSTAEIYQAGVAIKGDRIAAVGDVAYTKGPKTTVIDAGGRYLTPGLIDAHLHMYHSYLGVTEYAQTMLTHGITATADGFYGQGIVGGMDAIRFFKDAFAATPLRVIFLVPTLSYLQNRELGLTPASGISVEDMFAILDWPDCRGLEEPPYLPITEKFPEFLDLFEAALDRGKVITGHAAGITFRQLQAYVAMGTYTDHESTEHHDGLAKVRAGMKLLMREGSGANDSAELVRIFTEHGVDTRSLAYSTDLASAEKLAKEGGVDQHIRVAISQGVPPIKAVQMATINAAEIFGLHHDLGSISPGRFADILFVDDLVTFAIDRVIVGGVTVSESGRFTADLPQVNYPTTFYGSVQLAREITDDDLIVKVDSSDDVEVRVIGVTNGSLVTEQRRARLQPIEGELLGDVEHDVLPLAMADRLGKGTGIGLGFVQGFNLKDGAIASSVNAMCENLVAVGTNAADMAVAMNHVAQIGGGKVVVRGGKPIAVVELPVLGLISEDPHAVVLEKFNQAFIAIAELGCDLVSPFSQLEFSFACGEIGELKLSEEGLVRITAESVEKVGLFVEREPAGLPA
jgi:adenine deaminase